MKIFRSLFTLLILIALFSLALPVAAVDLGADPDTVAAEKKRWVERLQEKREALANAKARKATAEAHYTRMRTRNKARGDARANVRAELTTAVADVAKAQEDYDAVLEAARREGVPPGWLRDAGATRGPASPSDSR